MSWEQKIVRIMVVSLCFCSIALTAYGAVAAFGAALRAVTGKVALEVDREAIGSILKVLEPYEKGKRGE